MDKSLLIIDDDANILEIIAETLVEKFSKISTCSSVDEGIKILDSTKLDLVILDINLGGRNGAEIIKHLITTTSSINKETPVLICSGIINQSFITKNINKFAGIILKPFDLNELSELVESILSGKKTILEVDINSEVPNAPCVLPFTIPQLELKVNRIMDQVKKNSKLKSLFANLKISNDPENYMLEHIGMVINISTAISMALEWSTEKTLEKFVYAAYLHDMALNDRPDLAKIANSTALEAMKENLSRSDYKIVFEHSNLAALKIEEINEIPSDVAQIVRQHHENPKGEGFPSKLGATKISPLGAVFIVAHDMTDYIISTSNWTVDKFIQNVKINYKGQHFNKILQALDKLK
jgi:response regulator RpfG family c-di-GMP phosphodiesterase